MQHDQRGSESLLPTGPGGEAWDQSARGSDLLVHPESQGLPKPQSQGTRQQEQPRPECSGVPGGRPAEWWDVEPPLGRMADGVAARVGRLRALGNGQVPAVVRLAWHVLHERMKQTSHDKCPILFREPEPSPQERRGPAPPVQKEPDREKPTGPISVLLWLGHHRQRMACLNPNRLEIHQTVTVHKEAPWLG
jgi:hypothetical protein